MPSVSAYDPPVQTEKIPNVYGDMEWCITTICYMLKNEKYCGKAQIEVYLRGGSVVKQEVGN